MFMYNFLFLLLVVRHYSLCVCGDDVSAVKSKLLSEKSARSLLSLFYLLLLLLLLGPLLCVCETNIMMMTKKKEFDLN